MSRSTSHNLEQDLDYSHRNAAEKEESAFGERGLQTSTTKDNTTPATTPVTDGVFSTAKKDGNVKKNGEIENRDMGNMHVTFGNVSGPREPANTGSFDNNTSIYTNGSILRNFGGLQMASNTVENAPASSPLGMLYQSFANPISDSQAIENAVRETLGQEPMWRWNPSDTTTAPPVTVHDGDDAARARAALSTGDELRGCVDPAEHYIFRNCIRAPRGERPRPYLYTKDPDSLGLALAAAAQAAVRHRHRGLHSNVSATSESEEAFPHDAVTPLLGQSVKTHAAQEEKRQQQKMREEEDGKGTVPTATAAGTVAKDDTSPSSSRTVAHVASHEPAALTSEEDTTPNRHSSTTLSTAPVRLSAEEEVPMDPANKINRTYLCTGAFHAEPISEADISKEELIIDTFNALPSEQRRMEILEAFYVAHMQPYEQNASYTADDWDDMTETKVRRWFGVEFDTRRGCFFVTVFKRRVRVFLFSFLFRAFCLFLFWVVMFCLVPKNWFYPGGLYFDTIDTIVFAGIAGTLVARVLTIPSIVGVIWAGILWNNVPYTTRLTKGITLDMRQFIGMFGLTIGLIRAGLSLNVIRFKQKFKHYITFSLLPMSMEMLVHGICCKFIYHYPNYRWAFAEGFLLSSIAPSVVVPVIISFQRRGYGVRDGPSMMMLCSIAVDTAVCVWGIEFLLSLEFHRMSTALLIVLAPIQVLVGLVGGVILGTLVFVATFYILFMEGERLPSVRSDRMLTLRHSVHVRYISIFFMVLVSFSGIAVGKRFSVLGGSAIGVVTIAGTFNYLCVRGGTADHLRVKADMAQTLTTVWDYIAMPSLFGLSGAAVNVHELFSRSFIGQAFGLVFIGMGTRSLFAMLSPLITRLGLSWPEIIFCGIGWIGKGSVQGSLGSLAQTYATAELAAATTSEAKAVALQRIEYGRKMKNTAVLGILVACPICSIFLTRFTDRLLKPNT